MRKKSVDRRTNAKRNIYVSLLCQLVTMICGLITPRFLLKAFGSEANGAVTSITTFLGYIVLLEGGIGGVARAALYKPLAENDEHMINEIMAEMKSFFCHVGYVFSVYVIIIACSFKYISHSTMLDWTSSFFLVLIISASTFAQYFLGISNSILVIASQKQYIINLINLSATILNAVTVVILTSYGCSLLFVKLVSSIVFVMKPIVLWFYVKRNYNITPIKSKGNALKDKWTGLGQHLAYFLHTHTDVVVLTIFGDLNSVSVYGIYYMVINSIQSITNSFSAGMEAVFGDMYAKKEMAALNHIFNIYDTLVSIISIVFFGTTMVLIIPFVKIYTHNINDANYIQPLFSVLLAIALLLNCLRAPYHNMIIAAGHFRQTNIASYGEALINIISSILLVIKYGLIGVAIGTVFSTLFRFTYYAIYLARNIMKRKIYYWIKREAVNILNIGLIFTLGQFIMRSFSTIELLQWVVSALIVLICSSAITYFINLLFYPNDCALLFTYFRQRNIPR